MIHGLTSNFSTVLPITLNNLQNYLYLCILCPYSMPSPTTENHSMKTPQTNRTKIGSKLLICYVHTNYMFEALHSMPSFWILEHRVVVSE